MEQLLKHERNYKWGLWISYALWGGFGLWTICFDFTDLLPCAVAGIASICALNTGSNRVIKELKRENESLKSGGSADTTDPTPPEDE
jgi:hypothetical protein